MDTHVNSIRVQQDQEMKTHGNSSSIFVQGRLLLCIFVFFPVHQVPSEKGSTLKGKNSLPRGQILSF